MRAALYARYSTDQQSPTSVADQLRDCRCLAAKLEATVVAEFSDEGISGSSMVNRPGIRELMAFVEAKRCEIVIAEHTNRLARAGEDGWGIFHHLRELGVRYVTVEEGKVTVLHQGLSSLLSEQKLEESSHKTRRGLKGVAERGRSAGGRSYGYRPKRLYDAAGERIRGHLEIDETEAAVVRRILTDYAQGASPRAIAAALNAEGVPGPHGGMWNASTINGNAKRGNGILHNELYRGIRVWGRHVWSKDRRTAKRRARAGDPEDMVRANVPELRIVEDALWEAVRERRNQVAIGPISNGNRPKRLLSGLIRCGSCGGNMVAAGAPGRMVCSVRRERGPTACANGRTALYPQVEARVLAAIDRDMLHPEVIEEAVREFHRISSQEQSQARLKRAQLERELGEVKRKAERLVDQVAEGLLAGAAVKDKLVALEARRTELEAQLGAREEAQVVAVHPSAAGRYRKLIENLQACLDGPADTAERRDVHEALRALVVAVRIVPREGRGEYEIDIEGDLAPMLEISAKENGPLSGAAYRGDPSVMRALGAGTGFEPVTFRL